MGSEAQLACVQLVYLTGRHGSGYYYRLLRRSSNINTVDTHTTIHSTQ